MNKFFIALIVSICIVQSIVAQDVLITTEGEVMTVYIDDIGSSTIYYKTENSANASLQRIEKSKVYMIKKADTEDCTHTKRISSTLFAKNILGTGTSWRDISNADDCGLYFIGKAWNVQNKTVFPRP